MRNEQTFFGSLVPILLLSLLCCLFAIPLAEARPIISDDSWKVHVSASGHIPGYSGIRVQWWWNTDPPVWTYTEIYRCDDFLADPTPAASTPTNCTSIGGTNNFSGSSYGSWIDNSVSEGRYYWYKVRVCDSSTCVMSDRSSYDLNNGESSYLSGAWVGTATVAPHVPTGISVSRASGYSVKIAWTGNDPRMTDFFQLYRCTSTSMADCTHHPYYDPYHQQYTDYYFNEFYTYSGDSSDPGEDYYYRVKACAQGFADDSTSMRCSALSSYDHAPPTSAPPAPTGLSATDGQYFHYIEVVWNPSIGTEQYRVYRDGALIATVDATTYVDKQIYGLVQGTRYTYAVQACNAAGCSALSTSDSGYMNTQTGASIPAMLDLLLGGRSWRY
jgi:hypothetical protein